MHNLGFGISKFGLFSVKTMVMNECRYHPATKNDKLLWQRDSSDFDLMRNERADEPMPCREGCGACCIAPSITSPMPGMPHGKPAGERCLHLMADFRCALFGKPERPKFCGSLQPRESMCGANRFQALLRITRLEYKTR